MAGISLTSAIKVPKVSAEFAANAQTDSLHDVCPVWNHQDNFGRTVPYQSMKVLKGGCHDPSARMDIEMDLRPSYHPYLNLPGLDQDFTKLNTRTQNYGSSAGGYDTLGVRRDEAFGHYNDIELSRSSGLQTEDNGAAMDRNARLFQRVNETNRYRNFSGYI